jgi:hypothetical protein
MGNQTSSSKDYDENGVSVYDYHNQKISLEWLQKNAQTGDILLFSGSSIYSNAIKLFTMSDWTHVAVIIRRYDGIYVLQSVLRTRKYYKDYLTNEERNSGVMLNTLEDVIEEDKGKIYYRQLIISGYTINDQAVNEFLKKVKGKFYETNPIVLVSSVDRKNVAKDEDTLFCSELVFAFYLKIGIIENDWENPNNIIPSDYASKYDLRAIRLKSFAKFNMMFKVE